jgi:hypothetical protein
MALNFPSNPSLNDLYNYNGTQYIYDGSRWNLNRNEYKYAGDTLVNITGTITIDLSKGNIFKVQKLNSSVQIVFSNPSAEAHNFYLKIGVESGSVTITWPNSVLWENSTPSSPAAGTDSIFEFTTSDGGIRYYGKLMLEDL